MGRKKAESEDEAQLSGTPQERVINRIIKQYGAGSIISSEQVLAHPRMVIPISPALDGITGGIPEGSWLTITGPEKIGKTTLSLHIAAKCQRPENGARNVYYLNIEGRIKEMNLSGVHGLQPINIIQSTDDHIYTAQDFLNIGIDLLMSDPGCCLIVDSISALCDADELNNPVGSMNRGRSNQWIAQFTRKLAQIVPLKRSIVICMTHLIANTSGYGVSYMERTARALLYQADIKLKANSKKFYPVEVSVPLGQTIEWLSTCSALGHPPNLETTGFLRYGWGIDEIQENIEVASGLGLIKKNGSWYVCEFMKSRLDILGMDTEEEAEHCIKFQGGERLRNHIAENPPWEEALSKSIKELMT